MGVIEVDGDLLARAQAAGVDVSRVSEEALVLALDLRQKQVIREEIRQDLEALERYIAEHGDPVAEWNEAFGPPGGA